MRARPLRRAVEQPAHLAITGLVYREHDRVCVRLGDMLHPSIAQRLQPVYDAGESETIEGQGLGHGGCNAARARLVCRLEAAFWYTEPELQGRVGRPLRIYQETNYSCRD